MPKVMLSLGYDTERPYGQFAEPPEGKEFRKKQVDFASRLLGTLDREEAPRTLFILGQYLEGCLDDFSPEALREIYRKENPLNEIQQHSYSHPVFRTIESRPDKKPISQDEFLMDLQKASRVLKEVLDVSPTGLRTPLGYHHDLSDVPEIVKALEDLGFRYVSSDLRSKNSLEAFLTPERQPHTYQNIGCPGIVEIPSHGWQDVIFTAEKSQIYLGRDPDSAERIIEHFTSLFQTAKSIDMDTVYISLCLHPWAIMQYDPKLEIHKKIIGSARGQGIEIVHYRDIAATIRS